MSLNIGKEITALKRMTVADLRRKYAEVVPRVNLVRLGNVALTPLPIVSCFACFR